MKGGKLKKSSIHSLQYKYNPAIPDRSPVAQFLVAPWPEWSDADINAEKWETRAGSSDRQKVSTSIVPDDGFESPLDRVCMPPSIPVHVWRRSSSVNRGYKVLPEDVNAPQLDLVSCNEHILHSEIMRHLVTSIVSLHHLAAIKPFEDIVGDGYVPNRGAIWKPWHHVYSMCKAGKGTTHKPSPNKSGKYVVRLHFLGKWRCVTVDDVLPFDEHGRILLPTTTANVLWPLLLAKAVLRVAALTWTPTNEVADMNAISCFTGWFMLNIECKHVPAKDIWLVCQKALMNQAEEGARFNEQPKKRDAYQVGMSMGGGDRRDPLTYAMCNASEENWGAVAVFAEMAAIDGLLEEEVAEIGPCVGHQVLFSEARVIRLGDDGGPLPLWKTFRWKNWALKTGLIQPEHLVNVKSLRVFAPLKQWIVPNAESLLMLYKEMKASELAEEAERAEREMEVNKKKGSKKKEVGKFEKSELKSGKSKTESKTSGIKSSMKKEQEMLENTDPWMNFNEFSSYVKSIQLFFRASSFKHCRSTSDLHCFLVGTDSEQQPPPKKGKNEKMKPKGKSSEGSSPGQQPLEQHLTSTCKYKQRRTPDFFYLMSDTPTSNKIFITISGVSSNAITEQEAVLSQKSVVLADRTPMSMISMNFTETLQPSEAICRSSITTVGTKSALIQFGEGVVGLRVWTNLPPRHFIQIVSQADFKIGTYEVCHEILGKPSVSLVMYGGRIFEAFANLKKCLPGSPEHTVALATYHAAYLPDSLATNFTTTRSVVRFTTHMRATCEQVCVGLLYDRLKNDFDRFYSTLKELQELMLAPEYGMEYLQALDPEIHEKIGLRTAELARPPEEPEGSLDSEDAVVEHTDNGSENNDVQRNVKAEDKKNKKKGKPSPGKKSIKSEKKNIPKKSLNSNGPEALKKTANNSIPHILFDKQIASGIAVMSKIVDVQPDWAHFYPFRGDLKERIAFKDYVGTASVCPDGDWFPILRITLNMDPGRTASNLVYFSSTAALSFAHMINNDTQEEIPVKLQNLLGTKFEPNTLGYTYFAYGFCDNARIKEHSYKLHIVGPEDAGLLHCCKGFDPTTEACILAPPPPLKVHHVYGHYVPNRRNMVLQCILTVRRSQVLTIRVSTNNPKADILVKVTHDLDENEQCDLIYERRFSGKATLPSMYFPVDICEGAEEQQQKVFLIEGRLATDEGWKLTESEQNLVVGIKERVQKDLLVFRKNESTLRYESVTRTLSSSLLKTLPKSQGIIPEAAYWCVQVVVDSDMEKTVTLELNRRKEQEIRKLKADWERKEPGRHVRATIERRKILEMRDEEYRRMGIPFEKSELYQSFQLKFARICPEFHKGWREEAENYGSQQEEIRKQERQAFEEKLNEAAARRSGLCQEQKLTNAMVNRFLAEKDQASRALLDSGYRLRAAVVKATEKPGSGENKENKKKISAKPDKGPSKKRNML